MDEDKLKLILEGLAAQQTKNNEDLVLAFAKGIGDIVSAVSGGGSNAPPGQQRKTVPKGDQLPSINFKDASEEIIEDAKSCKGKP